MNTNFSLELPAQVLLAAAQFASTDDAKPTLNVISVEVTPEAVTLRSTDGHRAFRCRIPAGVCIVSDGAESFEISAAALRKSAARAGYAVITEATTTLLSHKREILELRPTSVQSAGSFPNLDQVWPDSYSFDSGRPLGFNAGYLKSIAGVCEKLAINGCLALSFNAASCATQITAEADVYAAHSREEHRLTLEFLLMPVMMRSFSEQITSRLEAIANAFNRRPAAQTEGLRASVKSDGVHFEKDGRPVFLAQTISQAQTASLYIKGGV